MTFGRKLAEPVQSWPWPTGQVSKPLDGRRRYWVRLDECSRQTIPCSSLEERIAALEKQAGD